LDESLQDLLAEALLLLGLAAVGGGGVLGVLRGGVAPDPHAHAVLRKEAEEAVRAGHLISGVEEQHGPVVPELAPQKPEGEFAALTAEVRGVHLAQRVLHQQPPPPALRIRRI